MKKKGEILWFLKSENNLDTKKIWGGFLWEATCIKQLNNDQSTQE